MIASLVWLVVAIFVILTLRQIKGGHAFEESLRIEALCRKAQRKYPMFPMIGALDYLYTDLYTELQMARDANKDVTQLIEDRQLIARERARLISAASERENGLKLIHKTKVA
jgi:hypothetical protein